MAMTSAPSVRAMGETTDFRAVSVSLTVSMPRIASRVSMSLRSVSPRGAGEALSTWRYTSPATSGSAARLANRTHPAVCESEKGTATCSPCPTSQSTNRQTAIPQSPSRQITPATRASTSTDMVANSHTISCQ